MRILRRFSRVARADEHATIFVQIASYRDPQLRPTIADCLQKAANPERLRFGVAWQHDSTDSLIPYTNDWRFRIISVPYEESRGVCWARHNIQSLYAGEDYTLQLDSHHRFVRQWDRRCMQMLKDLQSNGIEKPILTTYAPSFTPTEPSWRWARPILQMNFDKFTPEGSVSIKPSYAVERTPDAPMRARFLSGHFAFTVGAFCEDVPYDPYLYFHGEEISMTVRAFTHGYDLFHPHQFILWHEYSRQGRQKHWDDHTEWYVADRQSHARLRALLGVDGETMLSLGKFSLGEIRGIREYEQYAGICFSKKAVQQYTLDGFPPPNPIASTDEEWLQSFCRLQRYTVHLSPDDFPAEDDCDFWFVGAHDSSGREIHREDVGAHEIMRIDRARDWQKTREFLSTAEPCTWTVWPHSTSMGWLTKMTRRV